MTTRKHQIVYGGGWLPISVPERTRVITANPPAVYIDDLKTSVLQAINNPIAHEPLPDLVGNKSKVTIAFDDASGSYFQTKGADFRQVAIEIIVEELVKSGVKLNNINLLCAQGLHRKLSRTELETFLGRKLIYNSVITISIATMQKPRTTDTLRVH